LWRSRTGVAETQTKHWCGYGLQYAVFRVRVSRLLARVQAFRLAVGLIALQESPILPEDCDWGRHCIVYVTQPSDLSGG